MRAIDIIHIQGKRIVRIGLLLFGKIKPIQKTDWHVIRQDGNSKCKEKIVNNKMSETASNRINYLFSISKTEFKSRP